MSIMLLAIAEIPLNLLHGNMRISYSSRFVCSLGFFSFQIHDCGRAPLSFHILFSTKTENGVGLHGNEAA